MDCERADLLIGILEDELDPEERTEVESHLETCAPCRETLDAYRATADSLQALDRPQPSAEARAQAYAAVLQAMGASGAQVEPVEQTPSTSAQADAQPGKRGQLIVFARWVAAAACFLLVVSLFAWPDDASQVASGPTPDVASEMTPARTLLGESAPTMAAEEGAAQDMAKSAGLEEGLAAAAEETRGDPAAARRPRGERTTMTRQDELPKARSRYAQGQEPTEPDADEEEAEREAGKAGDQGLRFKEVDDDAESKQADALAGAPAPPREAAPTPAGEPFAPGVVGPPVNGVWHVRSPAGERIYVLRGTDQVTFLDTPRAPAPALARDRDPTPTVSGLPSNDPRVIRANTPANPSDLRISDELLAILSLELRPQAAGADAPAGGGRADLRESRRQSLAQLDPTQQLRVAAVFKLLGESTRPQELKRSLLRRLEKLEELHRLSELEMEEDGDIERAAKMRRAAEATESR